MLMLDHLISEGVLGLYIFGDFWDVLGKLD